MTKRGLLNSRMKDFYDLLVLSRQFDFNGAALRNSIMRTFANRNTNVQAVPIALTVAFASDIAKQTQWQGFLRKTKLDTRHHVTPVRYRRADAILATYRNRHPGPVTLRTAMGFQKVRTCGCGYFSLPLVPCGI